MRTLVGYLKDCKPGTELTDVHGEPLGWRVDVTITNQRTPDGDRVYVLRLTNGRGKRQRVGGGLYTGTLFRGRDLGIAPNPLDCLACRDTDYQIIGEAARWYQQPMTTTE